MKKQTSIFLVILLCILVAVAAGGTSYLVLANAHDQETQSLNDQIDRLETQVIKLQKEAKSTTTAKATTAPTTTENTTTATTTDKTSNNQTISDCSSALSLENLKNAYYTTQAPKTDEFKMTNGSYTKGNFSATLDTDHYACDSATKKDAAVIFNYSDGGTGYFYVLETFSNFKETPGVTALANLGDRVVIKSIKMSSGLITVNMLTQGPNDSAAEPKTDTVATYKLPTSGMALIKQ